MELSLEQIARALGVGASSRGDLLARGYSIDSRTVQPGELFFAVKGARLDGHAYVLEALGRGAVAAVVRADRRTSYPPHVHEQLIGVRETLEALQWLARFVRERWGKPLIAVTGSTGKTTTKEVAAALLGTRHRVAKSEGNLNNAYGLPLSLLQLTAEHDLAVMELGMSARGEIAHLAQIAQPNVGVVTVVSPVHLEFFNSLEEIAAAKYELIEGLKSDDRTAVLNADDARIVRFVDGFDGRVVRFGIERDAEVRARDIQDRGALGSSFELAIAGSRARVELALMGRHNVRNALAAAAAASLFGVDLAEARELFPRLQPAPMRGEFLRFEAGFAVINDCYNSNPLALESMLETLRRTPGYRRRILVAGEMKELGPTSRALHRRAGEQAAAQGIEIVIGVAGDASEIVAGAAAAGLPAERAHFFEEKSAAGNYLVELLKPGDLALLKGSRAVGLETMLVTVQAHFPLAKGAPRAQRTH